MNRLQGKRALVTAAAQGIGLASARLFAAEGAEVIATDINLAPLEAEAANSGIRTARLDVRSDENVQTLAAEIGPIDILFNCAGIVPHGDLLACSDHDWDLAFDLNVRSMFRTIRAFLPGMLERKSGVIVNMSSVVGSIKAAPNRFIYGVTKAAVVGMTKAIARDYILQGVRCNCLCPGTIDTPSFRGRVSSAGDAEAAYRDFVGRQPMGRLGQAEEIAAAALYLASSESAFMTGHTLVIDGGFSL